MWARRDPAKCVTQQDRQGEGEESRQNEVKLRGAVDGGELLDALARAVDVGQCTWLYEDDHQLNESTLDGP